MPVSCYICGRDFGTKSISIHIPNCIKKWDAEQKKLPKAQRRPPPDAPVDLERVIKGELKGADLDKYNATALKDWNDVALVACEHCARTFLPASLERHQKSCTAHNPMIKQDKDSSYTAKNQAKVSYPKFKKKKDNTQDATDSKENGHANDNDDHHDKKQGHNNGDGEDHGKNGHKHETNDHEKHGHKNGDHGKNGHNNSDHQKKPHRNGHKDHDEIKMPLSAEKDLATTFSKQELEQDVDTTRQFLAGIILNNSVFDSPDNRRKFKKIITKFISDRTTNL